MATQVQRSDLDRFRPSDRHNTLRHVSSVDCIEYEMHLRGSLAALYSLEGRVIGQFKSRSIRLYGKYLQGIQYLSYPNRSSFISKMSSECLAVHTDQNWEPQALILWVGPPLAVRPMSIAVGTWGYNPHTLEPSRVVYTMVKRDLL